MNGAESLVETLVGSGVDVCFTNPGTSEMHFVAALDGNDRMRAVLGLFEGVVTGAADGYGRMAGKPACTLLHLGPGLANGLANLHNARRAATPIVNIVGEHAVAHRALDAPLTSDIVGFARPVSGWIETATHADRVAPLGAEAVRAARGHPGRIATLILPADTAWEGPAVPAAPLPLPAPAACDGDRVDAVARLLRSSGRDTVLLLNGSATGATGLAAAARIAAATGARIYGDTFLARLARGRGRLNIERLPYFAEQVEATLAGVRHLVLVGTKPPVSFFAYPGRPSELTPAGCEVHRLAHPEEDGAAALDALAEALGAAAVAVPEAPRPERPSGPLEPASIAQAIGHLMPEGTIVSDEAATSGFALPAATAGAPPHDWLALTGGAIGQGLPLAVGAAVACPDRRVLALEADGSGMYTLQALWTMAREQLDVTVVVFANRKYAILQVEFGRVGANPGPKAMSMLDLSKPDLGWVELARGMGVEAARAETAEGFADLLAASLDKRGPFLIEAAI
jgi:acetolactate synthase-1/2/3 large subunit